MSARGALAQLSISVGPAPPKSRSSLDPWLNVPTSPVFTQIEAQRSAELSASLQSERESIDMLTVDVDQHIRRVTRLWREIERNPESSPLISKAIGLTVALFIVGVSYPLGWLPLNGPSHISFSPASIATSLISLRGGFLSSPCPSLVPCSSSGAPVPGCAIPPPSSMTSYLALPEPGTRTTSRFSTGIGRKHPRAILPAFKRVSAYPRWCGLLAPPHSSNSVGRLPPNGIPLEAVNSCG